MANSCPDPDAWAWAHALHLWHLNRCWALECDIDPMILRPRLLRQRGELPQVGESAHTRRFALFGQVDFF